MKKQTKKRAKKNNKKKPDWIVILFILFVVTTISCALFDNLFDSLNQKIQQAIPSAKPKPHRSETTTPEQPSEKAGDLTEADFTIAGLSLVTSPATVLNLFGDPLEEKRTTTTSFHNSDYNLYYYNWIYPELEIEFYNHAPKDQPVPITPGAILSIKLTNSFYQTKRGIRVDDPVTKLFEKYGQTKLEDNSYIYHFESKYLEFTVKDNKISTITIGQWFD